MIFWRSYEDGGGALILFLEGIGMLRFFRHFVPVGLMIVGLTGLLAASCLMRPDREAYAYRQDSHFKSHGKKLSTIRATELPPEARVVLKLIKNGGPFPYRKDGTTFGNREKLLPLRKKGYYKEYTVKTPGRRDRGPRRIVAGSGGEYYYTNDHYRSFKLIQE
jgi:ribonuclease T1